MGGKNNRALGIKLEQDVITYLAEHWGLKSFHPTECKTGFDIASTRLMSKGLDDMGVDVYLESPNTPEFFKQFWIQIKRQTFQTKSTALVEFEPLFRIYRPLKRSILIKQFYRKPKGVKRNKKLGIYVFELLTFEDNLDEYRTNIQGKLDWFNMQPKPEGTLSIRDKKEKEFYIQMDTLENWVRRIKTEYDNSRL